MVPPPAGRWGSEDVHRCGVKGEEHLPAFTDILPKKGTGGNDGAKFDGAGTNTDVAEKPLVEHP